MRTLFKDINSYDPTNNDHLLTKCSQLHQNNCGAQFLCFIALSVYFFRVQYLYYKNRNEFPIRGHAPTLVILDAFVYWQLAGFGFTMNTLGFVHAFFFEGEHVYIIDKLLYCGINALIVISFLLYLARFYHVWLFVKGQDKIKSLKNLVKELENNNTSCCKRKKQKAMKKRINCTQELVNYTIKDFPVKYKSLFALSLVIMYAAVCYLMYFFEYELIDLAINLFIVQTVFQALVFFQTITYEKEYEIKTEVTSLLFVQVVQQLVSYLVQMYEKEILHEKTGCVYVVANRWLAQYYLQLYIIIVQGRALYFQQKELNTPPSYVLKRLDLVIMNPLTFIKFDNYVNKFGSKVEKDLLDKVVTLLADSHEDNESTRTEIYELIDYIDKELKDFKSENCNEPSSRFGRNFSVRSIPKITIPDGLAPILPSKIPNKLGIAINEEPYKRTVPPENLRTPLLVTDEINPEGEINETSSNNMILVAVRDHSKTWPTNKSFSLDELHYTKDPFRIPKYDEEEKSIMIEEKIQDIPIEENKHNFDYDDISEDYVTDLKPDQPNIQRKSITAYKEFKQKNGELYKNLVLNEIFKIKIDKNNNTFRIVNFETDKYERRGCILECNDYKQFKKNQSVPIKIYPKTKIQKGVAKMNSDGIIYVDEDDMLSFYPQSLESVKVFKKKIITWSKNFNPFYDYYSEQIINNKLTEQEIVKRSMLYYLIDKLDEAYQNFQKTKEFRTLKYRLELFGKVQEKKFASN